MTGQLVVGAALAGALVAFVLTAGAVLTRRTWAPVPVLAPAYGFVLLGPALLVVAAGWLLGPVVGTLTSWSVVAGCAVVVVRQVRRTARGRVVAAVVAASPLVALTGGLLLATLGLLTLWRSDLDPFALASVRFSHPLPVDGRISSMVTERLVAGLDPRAAVPGWLSSDRPPLQTGVLLLTHGVFGTPVPGVAVDAAAGMVAQSTWVLGAWSTARVLGLGRQATLVGLVATGVSGSVLVNTVFTWPKLLSAGFVLAALALALAERQARGRGLPGRSRLPEVALLLVFGLLSHGAAVFAVPVVLLCLGRPRRTTLRAVPRALALAVACYAPWWAYQRFYDPPGDRLLSMHLAGVPEPTSASFLQDLGTAYGALDWSQIVSNKLANLAFPLGTAPWASLQADWADPGVRATQFFTVSGALAFTWVPLVALAATGLVSAVRRPPRDPDDTTARVLGVLGACALALVAWALLMFGPATTYVHQGSHVPILLAGVLTTAWLAARSRLLVGVTLTGQLVTTGWLYGPVEGVPDVSTTVDPTAVVALAAGLLTALLAAAWSRSGVHVGPPSPPGSGVPALSAARPSAR